MWAVVIVNAEVRNPRFGLDVLGRSDEWAASEHFNTPHMSEVQDRTDRSVALDSIDASDKLTTRRDLIASKEGGKEQISPPRRKGGKEGLLLNRWTDPIAKFTIWQTAARRLAGWIAEPSKCGLRWQKWCAYAVASETEISIA